MTYSSEPDILFQLRRACSQVCCALHRACTLDDPQQPRTWQRGLTLRARRAQVFEIIRRYKIMNPEKLRDTYGKLIYLLQVYTSDEVVMA